MLPKLSTRARLSFGLSMIVVSVMLMALAIGILPDHQMTVMKGRCALSESLALQTRPLILQRELQQMQRLLEAITNRNDDVLSAGLRRSDGELVVSVGEHQQLWNRNLTQNDDRQVYVPLHTGQDEQWGQLELTFQPVRQAGIAALVSHPHYQLVAVVGVLSCLLFNGYLWLMLRQVDAKNVAPERVREAYSKMADGVLLVNKDQRIILANESFAGSVGRSVDELIGKRLNQLPWFLVHENEDSLDLEAELDEQQLPWVRAIDGEEINQSIVLGCRISDHIQSIFTVGCSVFRDEGDQLRGMLISFSNVTELEQTKRELSLAKEHAESANQAKSSFLANMSHEIRTPMNAVLGFTDILRRGIESEPTKQQKYLNTIHASGSHLLSLINDILDLSKVEAGRMEVESIECHPHTIVGDVLQVLSAPAKKKNLKLGFECLGPIPATIHSDPSRIRQVLLNLTGNAIKFTSEGGVTIQVQLDETGPHPLYEFRVKDTGIGLSDSAMQKIFDPFSQADSSTTRKFGGTGLGLSISKRFSEALGGDIRVESEIGVGSTFIVRVAVGDIQGVDRIEPTLDDLDMHHDRADAGIEHLPALNLLVVDDGEENRDLISVILEQAGVDFVTAVNGQEAVDLASQQSFDAILMDMQMPVMDGYTAASTLRKAGMTLPIVALTAHAMQGDADKCFEAGCSHFLTKPIDIDRLLGLLSEIAAELGITRRKEIVAPAEPAVAQGTPLATDSDSQIQTEPADHSDIMASTGPIETTLPMANPKFQGIVRKFTDRLNASVDAIEQACRDQDAESLRSLAHGLKGTSANCGFMPVSKVVAQVEQCAKDSDIESAESLIRDLKTLASRVVGPDAPVPEASSVKATPARKTPTRSRRAMTEEEMMSLDLSLDVTKRKNPAIDPADAAETPPR
ncbi:hybrid sensor histidine kinase/response regulator [Crateriforma conspicua]|uniref:hybrid sensor histidine kinase/response regulator n=1 Tax=Crateriforma conspicua TaxID=2527996 RepID=UPI00118B736B|nr:ATP-binding protein [Crateriforma conspicua]QDV64087.1 Sensory/regulatory protein RpfC [Crateriforma conspicua]